MPVSRASRHRKWWMRHANFWRCAGRVPTGGRHEGLTRPRRLMYTLGINAAFHDCSAALVRDGIVLAAAEEERFTRIKHGKRPVPFSTWQLPYHAVDYCLAEAGCTLNDV